MKIHGIPATVAVILLCSILILVTASCDAPWRTAILEADLHDVDLIKTDDGLYTGGHEYRGFVYQVQAEVYDHRIMAVEISDWEPNDARIRALEVLGRVVEQQSLCVDAVSGATTASKLYLLCLEDAFPYLKKEKCPE
jgi:uncharacterized protein with FMN-binding domain